MFIYFFYFYRLDDKLIGRRSVTKSTTPRLENNRKVRSEPKQTEAFFYSERTNYQNFEPNNPKQIGNYFHQSRRQEEPKKIVKFSEVSGCEERNNVAGAQGRGTYVRELEVCFDQVLNKGNLSTKEIVKQLETTISVPVNGDCRIDPGLKRPPPIFGRLPAKTDRRETLWEKLIKRKYLTQVN